MFKQNPAFYSKLGFSYVHFACEPQNKDHPEILEFLLESYEDLENSSEIDVENAVGKGSGYKILDTEFANGQNRFLETPLHLATKYSLPEHVKILLEFEADPRLVTSDGYSALKNRKLLSGILVFLVVTCFSLIFQFPNFKIRCITASTSPKRKSRV